MIFPLVNIITFLSIIALILAIRSSVVCIYIEYKIGPIFYFFFKDKEINVVNILLIPGTGASTISVTDKKTNKKVYAWVGNTDYIKNGTNFMTCHWNRKTK